MDLAKVHVAGRVVGCGRALGHRGARLVGGHGEGELTRDVGRGQAFGGLELLGAGECGINGIGAVDVLEQGLNAVVDRRCRQGTVAVIDDNDLKAKARRCGRDALGRELRRELKGGVTDGPCKPGIRIGADGALGIYQVSEHLGGVMQGTEAYMLINVGSARALNGFLLTCVGDAKVELAVGHRATAQGLGGNDLSSGATSRVGRSTVAVDERDHGALDRSGTSLVLGHQRALGAARNGRRGGERTGGVVGDGDRHGADSVVVGVAGLAVVLLGHGVLEGLTGVSLRKLDLMASQDVNQADRSLCRRGGLEFVGAGQQAKRVGRSLVGGRHGKGELALGHGTSGEGLAELEAAGRGVVKLSAIRVGKASVFLLGDVGGQFALAVLGHGHFGGRDMGVIRHADRAARVLADLVLVGSGSRVANLAKLDGGDAVLRVALARGYGCRIGQRGAVGSGDGKAELVPIRPLATVDGLAQTKVEVCIGRGHAVGVGELGLLGFLQDMLRLERAVALVGDGGLDGELGVAVGDTLAGGSTVDLAQRVDVRAGLVVGDLAHRDVAVGVVGTGGDDLGALALALDELEAKLAVLEVASGQNLGRGDLVGDTRLDRLHVIGIGERKCSVSIRLVGYAQLTLAVIGHGEGNLARQLGVVGHASDLAGLGHGVGEGVLALLGLLAHSLVKVVERKGDLAKVDLAVGAVAHARALGHRRALFADHGKGELASDVGRGQALGDLQILLARKRCLGIIRGVGVLELDALGILGVLGVLQLMRGHQPALAVIADGRHDDVGRAVVGDTVGLALNLAQLVVVLADLGVLDGAERHLAVGSVLNGLDKLGVLALILAQLKAELAFRQVASGQGLGHGDLAGDAGLNRLRSVNVLELVLACFTPSHLHGSAEHALLVGRHRHGDLRDVLAVGDAVNRGPGVLFANLVDIRAGLGVFDRTEVNGSLALVIQIALGHGHSRELGHRGVALGRQTKLKPVRIPPVAALEHLGQTKLGLGVHRCRRHVVRKADLAVIAQVGVDMRRGQLCRRVVPLGVEHVGRGIGLVVLLDGVELIDKGQTRGAHSKHQVTVLIGNNRAVELRGVAADKLDDGGGGLGLAVLALLLKLILVVIGAGICQRARCRLRAFLIRVNRRLLLEVVVAVGVGRLKGRNCIAQRAATPLVRVEIHGVGAVNDGRIMLDVILEPRDLLGRKQVVERSALHARGILHLDGLNVVDRKLAVYGLKVALRNQRRRNLDRYDIAGLGLVLFGMLNGDDQVRGITRKCVGVDVVLGLCRLVKRRAVVYKTVDLHKVAQLIGKRNVAGLGRVVTLVDFGRVRCFRRNGL